MLLQDVDTARAENNADFAFHPNFAWLGAVGTGKSEAASDILHDAAKHRLQVHVATATGRLSVRYRSKLPKASVDTLHGTIGVGQNPPAFNYWSFFLWRCTIRACLPHIPSFLCL